MYAITTFDYIMNIGQFLSSKTEHTMRSSSSYEDTDDLLRLNTEQTNDLLCLNTEHTDDLIRSCTHSTKFSKWEYTEYLLRPKMRIPNLSYVRNRQCRTNRTYQWFLTFETKQAEVFLQRTCRFRSVVSTRETAQRDSYLRFQNN